MRPSVPMLYFRLAGQFVCIADVRDEQHLNDLWQILQEPDFLAPEGLDA